MNDSSHLTTRTGFLAAGLGGAMLAAAAPAAALTGLHDLEGVLHRSTRHKQVIAAVKIDQGTPLRHAVNALNAFEYAYGEGPGSLHVACVLYGPALFFAANDRLWGDYHLFDVLNQAQDGLPLMLHTPENPFLRPVASARRDDASVETLMLRGVTFLVCNNALTAITRTIAQNQHADERGVYEDFLRNLVPGALVVPAGVAAIILAQEAGYTFLGG